MVWSWYTCLHTDTCPGNLHLNIVAKEYSDEVTNALEPFVYELVGECSILYVRKTSVQSPLAKYRGSVSAEHGIGSMKTHALPYTKDAVSIGLMKRIKNLFDPNGIMNPGKVLE